MDTTITAKLDAIAIVLEAAAGLDSAQRQDVSEQARLQRIADALAAWVPAIGGTADGAIPAPVGPNDGDFLRWDAGIAGWTAQTAALPDLTDVDDALAPASGHFLRHDGSEWASALLLAADIPTLDHGGLDGLADDDHTQYHNDTRALAWLNTKSIDELSDVVISSPIVRNVLRHNGTNWANSILSIKDTYESLLADGDPAPGTFECKFLVYDEFRLWSADYVYLKQLADVAYPVSVGSGYVFMYNGSKWDGSAQSGIDHGSLGGLTDLADHPGYVACDGTRPLTAAWDAGTYKITNDEITVDNVLTIPAAAGGKTVDAAGEICVDTTSKTLNFYDGAAEVVLDPECSKSITIEDAATSDEFTMFRANKAITITKMVAVCVGSSPSVPWTIRHSTDRSATGNEVVTGGTTTTSTTTGSVVTSFNDATIPADSFVWIELGTVTGTVDEFHVTVFYKVDA